MFSIANTKSEEKEKANNRYSVKFQGNYFRPCIGLMHWVRWGKFILDIRPLREYLGLPQETQELYIALNQTIFEERIKQITDAVGDKSFFSLNSKVNEMIIEKKKATELECNTKGIPYDDALGF